MKKAGYDKDAIFDSALLVACTQTGGHLFAMKANLEAGTDEGDATLGCMIAVFDLWSRLVGAMESQKPLPMFCSRAIKLARPVLESCPGHDSTPEQRAYWIESAVDMAVNMREVLRQKAMADVRNSKMPAREKARAIAAMMTFRDVMQADEIGLKPKFARQVLAMQKLQEAQAQQEAAP